MSEYRAKVKKFLQPLIFNPDIVTLKASSFRESLIAADDNKPENPHDPRGFLRDGLLFGDPFLWP